MFKKALFASAAVMAAGVASAEVTGNFAVVSDYIFRGADSSNGPAVQGGLDYSHASGLYAGVWMSNASLGTNSDQDEVDYYVGYGLGLNENLSLDIGVVNYNTDANRGNDAGSATINEFYVGLAGEAWDATIYVGDRGDDAGDADDYMYLDLNYGISTGETTSVDLHLGYTDEKADASADIIDIAITYNVGDFSIGATLQDIEDSTQDERANLWIGWGTEFDVK
ncbi:MAG: TorF family putative porin [Gammaproteobacteria bacterium]|nr:TorF family putative porin [Gammaproteobacteria bacterium]